MMGLVFCYLQSDAEMRRESVSSPANQCTALYHCDHVYQGPAVSMPSSDPRIEDGGIEALSETYLRDIETVGRLNRDVSFAHGLDSIVLHCGGHFDEALALFLLIEEE